MRTTCEKRRQLMVDRYNNKQLDNDLTYVVTELMRMAARMERTISFWSWWPVVKKHLLTRQIVSFVKRHTLVYARMSDRTGVILLDRAFVTVSKPGLDAGWKWATAASRVICDLTQDADRRYSLYSYLPQWVEREEEFSVEVLRAIDDLNQSFYSLGKSFFIGGIEASDPYYVSLLKHYAPLVSWKKSTVLDKVGVPSRKE